jgi:putative ABC transport system permease protein
VILLRLISWPYVRRHLARVSLTTLGIVLGVAVFVAMYTANQAVVDGLEHTVDQVAGKAQLQVTAGDGGFPEDVLERVQAMPEVRVAVPLIEAALETNLDGQGNLLVLAVDMTGDRTLRDYDLEGGSDAVIDDPLVFLAQPDSLMVTHEFAERNGLEANSTITLGTMLGNRTFTIRGIMRPSGLGSAFGGNLAIMDIYAAQYVFGRGRMFDRIDLALADSITLDAGRMALEAALGPGFNVEPPSSRGQQFESVLSVYSITMSVSSLFALFIGMFIIYNSFAIAVTQRRRDIGVLRALGAFRSQIRTLFLVEGALAGLIGSALGCLAGVAMGRGMIGQIGSMLEGVYGLVQRPAEIALTPGLIGFALSVGVVTSVVAAYVPARQAARVDPVQALQKGRHQVLTAGENRARRRIALVMVVVAALCLWLDRHVLFYPGYFLTILAALLLTPTLALLLAQGLRPVLRWLRPVEGTLAADSLIQAPRRTSGTVAALMLALAQVVGLGGLSLGSYVSITDWVERTLDPDLFVAANESLAVRTFRFPASVGYELEAIEGIDAVQRVRSERLRYGDTPVLVVSVEIDRFRSRGGQQPTVAGDPDEMYTQAAAGRGLLVSENFANLQRVHLNDVLDIPTPGGSLRLPVVGIVKDWSDQLGTILLDRQLFIQQWNDDSVNVFRVYLEPGAAASDVRARILARLGTTRRLFVLTNEDVRDYIMSLTNQWMGMTNAQIAVAVLVAVLGIVNTLTVSILDRRRELGVIRAVGGLRGQVRRTIWMEAVGMSIIGVVLGLALGAINLYCILEAARRDIGGMNVDYAYPVSIALFIVPTMLVAAFVSALGPGESAVRGSLVEALEYE